MLQKDEIMLKNSLAVYNGQLKATMDIDLESIFSDNYAYEVIRLINANPLFLENHLDRLVKSCEALNDPPLDRRNLVDEIGQMIRENQLEHINIKIMIYGNQRIVFPIKSHYPSEEEYLRGVQCSLLFEERENPEVKVHQSLLRGKANEQIQAQETYESVLVNKQGLITEGSRSNLFFIKGEVIHTAEDALVLGGITRKKVLDICQALHLKLSLKAITLEELASCQAAFICGTSPGVLPIQNIENYIFEVQNPVLQKIHDSYHVKYLNQ